MDTLKQMALVLATGCVLGLTHANVRRAGLEHFVSIPSVKEKVYSMVGAQTMVSVARLDLASAWRVGGVKNVRFLYVNLDARMVASVLHLTHVSAHLSGWVISAH